MSIDNLILGDQHIHKYESLNVEFKEFCLNLTPCDFDCLNIEKICKTGIVTDDEKVILNNMIINSIKKYFIKYIPRYLSAFINSKIDNAEMYIGVDDYGEITGIPFFGTKDDFEKIVNVIADLPLYYTKSTNKSIHYKVIIEELDVKNDLLVDNSNIMLKNFYNDIMIVNNLRKKYRIERSKWISMLDEFTCKLPVLLETKKKDFNEYLQKHAPHLLNYKILPHEMKNIAHLKVDPTHYLYWLMQFKEEHINKLQSIRPNKPRIQKINHGPYYLLNNLTELRSKFIKNNQIRYFLIKIQFPESKDYNTVYYYNSESKTWLTKQRYYNQNVGPCCL